MNFIFGVWRNIASARMAAIAISAITSTRTTGATPSTVAAAVDMSIIPTPTSPMVVLALTPAPHGARRAPVTTGRETYLG